MDLDIEAHYILMNDIDASATNKWNFGNHDKDSETDSTFMGFSPISYGFNRMFSGTLDGKGFSVSNLYINRISRNHQFERNGLFSWLRSEAIVRELGVRNCEIRGDMYSASIAAVNEGVIENVNSSGTITGIDYPGGLVGINRGTIINSHSVPTVIGEHGGGFAAINEGEIKDSYTRGNINGNSSGGFVAQNSGMITNCYSTSEVISSMNAGGFACSNSGRLYYCSYSGRTEGTITVGGFVSSNLGVVSFCYSKGIVYSDENVGGLVGFNSGRIYCSHSSSNVISPDIEDTCGIHSTSYGGFVGTNNGYIVDSYSSGDVYGVNQIGSFAGNNNGFIYSSYSTGSAFGELIGGFSGGHGGWVGNCFWDSVECQRSHFYTPADEEIFGLGRTSEEMRDVKNYTDAGWDFENIWTIDSNTISGLPTLRPYTNIGPADTDGDGMLNISSVKDFRWLSETAFAYGLGWELDNDIDLTGSELWFDSAGCIPIFVLDANVDGHGYTIKNMFINRRNPREAGLYETITDPSLVQNLGILDCRILRGSNSGAFASKNRGSLVNCYSSGTITHGGGLVCSNNGSIKKSYSTCAIIDNGSSTGGLVAYNNKFALIQNSYYIGDVGQNYEDSHRSRERTGGIAGTNEGSIVHCYTVSKVMGYKDNVGPIVSPHYDSYHNNGETVYCVWNSDVSGITKADEGHAKTTDEMRKKSTYEAFSWDFNDVWSIAPDINDGYPYLQGVGVSVQETPEAQKLGISLYPNPANEFIKISIKDQSAIILNVRIVDLFGRLVKEGEVAAVSSEIIIPVSEIVSGYYLIRIQTNREYISLPLIVE